jgi:hypothetical protein
LVIQRRNFIFNKKKTGGIIVKVIHQGTVVQASFGVLDDEGNVVQTIQVGPDPQQQQDPLNIKQLRGEAFGAAHGALVQLKQQLQDQVDEQVQNAPEVITNVPDSPPVEAVPQPVPAPAPAPQVPGVAQ